MSSCFIRLNNGRCKNFPRLRAVRFSLKFNTASMLRPTGGSAAIPEQIRQETPRIQPSTAALSRVVKFKPGVRDERSSAEASRSRIHRAML